MAHPEGEEETKQEPQTMEELDRTSRLLESLKAPLLRKHLKKSAVVMIP